jgi:hypothetical protein
MALQPKSGPGLPFWGFVTINFLQCCIVSPAPNPQSGGPGLTPGDRVAQLYPQALGTHFSRLLRHECVTVGLFFNPGHHTGSLSWFSSVPQGSFWGRPGSILPYPFQFIINIIRHYSLELLITSLNKPQTNTSFSAFMYHSWEMVRDSLFEPALECWSNELWFSIPEVGSRQYCYTRHWHMFLTNDSSLETVTCL